MSRREVQVELSFSVIVDEDTPMAARSSVASQMSEVLNGIENRTEGSVVGTRGGAVVDE